MAKRKAQIKQESGKRVIIDYVRAYNWDALADKVNAMISAGAEIVGPPVIDNGMDYRYVQAVKVVAE